MKSYFLLLIATCTFTLAQAQMTATFNTIENTLCNGSDCSYAGPSIMINEIMISPTTGDGSIAGSDASRRAEWIELYNPNLCEPVDISCYYMGSAAPQGAGVEGEGVQIPGNTIVPSGGFCVVRGVNAEVVPSANLVANGGNTVEVIIPGDLSGDGTCVDGSFPTRLWFPNSGGWFAFYDGNGVAQDAISWASQQGIGDTPCVAEHSTCNSSGISSLASYNNIPNNRKEKVYNGAVPNSWGKSIRRIPDGGAWQTNTGDVPTEGDCNGVCAPPFSSTCDGEATINVSGGTTPYTYAWDDSEGQLTQTATGLCDGTYTVTVTDGNSNTETFTVEVENFEPAVNLTINEEFCNYGQTVSMDDIATYSPLPGPGETSELTGTGVTGTDFDISVSGAGDFEITYNFTDDEGCFNVSDTSNLIVHEVPNPQITDIEPAYCIADSIVTPTLTPTGGTFSGPGVNNDEFNITDAGVGTHTLKYVVENQYGCTDSTEVTVVVHDLPTFDLELTEPECAQSDGEIIITPNAGTYPYGYSIDDGVSDQTDSTFANLSAGDYAIIVSDDNGCMSSMDTTLTTNGAKDPSFSFADYCEGESNGPTDIVTQDGEFNFNPPANDGATIDSTTGVISNGVAGTTYTVQHITFGICADTATIDVTVYSMPDVNASADPIQGMPPLVVNFTNNSTGADNYTWNFGDGSVIQNNDDNISHTYTGENVFNIVLTGETNNGMCTDTSTLKIITAYPEIDYKFPNVFTPNGDGKNDGFHFVHRENIKTLHIIILNRWGNLVFESSRENFQWNGLLKNSGAECSDGTYFYKAELTDLAGEEYVEHGFIHLNRDQ